MQQTTSKGSDHVGFGKHGANTSRKFFRWITNTAARSTKWRISNPTGKSRVLFVAEESERLPGTKSGKQYDPRTYDETHQTTGGGEALRRTASTERTRPTSPDSRSTRDQLNNNLVEGKPLIERTSSEVYGTSSVVDNVFARAWRDELGREL